MRGSINYCGYMNTTAKVEKYIIELLFVGTAINYIFLTQLVFKLLKGLT